VNPLTESTRPIEADFPEQIRVSTGTAMVLGLLNGKVDAAPTTAYLMTYRVGKCASNCGFCPQARGSKSSIEFLSRVSWPIFQTSNVTPALAKATEKGIIKRVCIQALNYPNVFVHLKALVQVTKNHSVVPISVSCQPLNKENIELLKKAGVNRLGIALDAATEAVFNKVKGKDVGGSYIWEGQLLMLREALQIFGKGNVSTHIIVGLGETEREAAEIVQKCVDMGILPVLFAFTPVRGTALECRTAPLVQSYRRIQLTRYLIVKCLGNYESMQFDSTGRIQGFSLGSDLLKSVIDSGEPFRTSGCEDCNRPFYNEKPSGPIYNYPQKPNLKEIKEIKRQLDAV
jgi:biotin synthase-related radical SAM superfamily protein